MVKGGKMDIFISGVSEDMIRKVLNQQLGEEKVKELEKKYSSMTLNRLYALLLNENKDS